MSKKFYIAIVGGLPTDYNLLDAHLNQLIEESGCYLFTILCSGAPFYDVVSVKPLSLLWAERNGCPVEYICCSEGGEKITKMLFDKVDYVVFILHKDDIYTKKLFMKYKMLGKHGSVIQVKE